MGDNLIPGLAVFSDILRDPARLTPTNRRTLERYEGDTLEQMRIAVAYQQAVEELEARRGQRDGVVVTPVEVVDYIVRSTISASGGVVPTEILDPFGGTGIFLARYIQLLHPALLLPCIKVMRMQEISPLAAWIAERNLEAITWNATRQISVVPTVVCGDTFQSYEDVRES